MKMTKRCRTGAILCHINGLEHLECFRRLKQRYRLLAEFPGGGVVACITVLLCNGETPDGLVPVTLHTEISGSWTDVKKEKER